MRIKVAELASDPGKFRLAYHRDGRPRGWWRAVVLKKSGTPRKVFRRVVYKKNGYVRSHFVPYVSRDEVARTIAGAGDMVGGPISVDDWLRQERPRHRPLSVFPDPECGLRINVVTDSIGRSSLFGGVGTSLILGALLAQRLGTSLRIVARTERPDNTALRSILAANAIDCEVDAHSVFAEHSGGREISLRDEDYFIATSWWTARCLLNTVPAKRIIYLLQEDERMFYPHGDEHLECSWTLAEDYLQVLINTNLLRDHLLEGPDPVPGLADHSLAFEPAFAVQIVARKKAVSAGRKKLFFYARPAHTRNLFRAGLAALSKAITDGALNPDDWEFHLVGNDLPQLKFPRDMMVTIHPTMPWSTYQRLMRTMDAGFVLMHTPHPSYPPLDLAAMGIPVLTNRYGIKQDLSRYSENLICRDLDPESLVSGFRELIERASDPELCAKTAKSDAINRDWQTALAPVLDGLQRQIAAQAKKN